MKKIILIAVLFLGTGQVGATEQWARLDNSYPGSAEIRAAFRSALVDLSDSRSIECRVVEGTYRTGGRNYSQNQRVNINDLTTSPVATLEINSGQTLFRVRGLSHTSIYTVHPDQMSLSGYAQESRESYRINRGTITNPSFELASRIIYRVECH